MRKFGLRAETLGKDYNHAAAVIEKYNAEWETTKEQSNKIVSGDIAWLIHQYEKDPTWYRTKAMLDSAEKDSVNIIVSEETGKPYRGKEAFGKVFRKVRKWAGIERPLTF